MPADTSTIAALIDLVRGFAPGLPSSERDAALAPLPEAGLTSMGTVKLMLALEAAYDLAIPDADLTPENFRTVSAIEAMVVRLRMA